MREVDSREVSFPVMHVLLTLELHVLLYSCTYELLSLEILKVNVRIVILKNILGSINLGLEGIEVQWYVQGVYALVYHLLDRSILREIVHARCIA